ncbi:MAG: EAL domain-containing response regulator [Proteobacteria bacterium]|nr:EAL domain-containing response regulator [Pseudomonadota bacterium]
MTGIKHRLLVVDDEVEVCEIIREVGETAGYEVKTTTSGVEFCALYLNFNPTFILLDLNIPEFDGIELLRFLAQHNCTCPIVLESGQDEKVLAISSKLGEEMGLTMGPYFQKPVSVTKLMSALETNKEAPQDDSPDFLRHAIANKRIVLHYQPKVSFKTNQVVGIEALVRLEVQGKLIPPDSFIPLAEESNLIRSLSQLIVQIAFQEYKSIINTYPEISLSVNLSPKTLDDLLMPDEFTKMAQEHNIDTKNICLEITETAFSEHKLLIADVITRFRIKGFTISIDDFGTGYSSLAQLHNLPFNEIKIDKSFITHLGEDLEARKITQSVIDLGHSLGLTVTAEGIETKEVWDILASQGCDIAQGFYICHPLEFDKLTKWLALARDGVHTNHEHLSNV